MSVWQALTEAGSAMFRDDHPDPSPTSTAMLRARREPPARPTGSPVQAVAEPAPRTGHPARTRWRQAPWSAHAPDCRVRAPERPRFRRGFPELFSWRERTLKWPACQSPVVGGMKCLCEANGNAPDLSRIMYPFILPPSGGQVGGPGPDRPTVSRICRAWRPCLALTGFAA